MGYKFEKLSEQGQQEYSCIYMEEMLEGRAVSCRDRVSFVRDVGQIRLLADLNIKKLLSMGLYFSFYGHSIKRKK